MHTRPKHAEKYPPPPHPPPPKNKKKSPCQNLSKCTVPEQFRHMQIDLCFCISSFQNGPEVDTGEGGMGGGGGGGRRQ